jgi:cytochrome c oxidase cbb3-type subunit 4
MDIGTLRGLLTLILMLAFLGIVFWAYSKNRKKDFEEASRLPLEEGDADPREYRHE